MKLFIGTNNEIKISALREIGADYDFLKDAIILGINTGSNVADQPKTLAETVSGAKHRAQTAFNDCDLGVGIEDGLMEVSESLTGFMNVTAAAIYDGKRFYLGLSSAFEYPPKAIELVNRGMDINQAFYELGLTSNPKIGSAQGAIGILTKNRWQRKDLIKQALCAAFIQLDNKLIY